jgi:hypothetical protein
MNKIIVFFPHFGTLPPQYKMWRASALYNTDIDFMFFTDCDVEPAKNIIVHKMSFANFKQMVQIKFDFPIMLDRPYKICDYRPAFAYIFSEFINGYDFWGWGDLDVVYGDIRHFVTDDVLLHYKMISGFGHFTLYKNDEYVNTFFMKKVDGYVSYKEAFSQRRSMYFDEYEYKGFGDKWRDCHPEDCWLKWPFDNASKPKQSYHFNSLTRGWQQVIFEHIDNKLYMIRFNHGKIEKKESLYAHFQHRSFMKDRVTDYSHFLITPNAIIDYPKHFINIRLRWLCRDRSLMTKYYQWKDLIIWKLGLSKSK